MDTIALWEEEIEENSKSHYFEETQKQIDFLCESIELDYKLMDLGLIREADEEDNSDNSAKDLKFTKKIKLVLGKIAKSLLIIGQKIRKFIQEKINDFKQNNIIKKFAGAKINPEQMAEKLNKTTLFDPDRLYSIYLQFDVFGERVLKILNQDITVAPISDILEVDKYTAKQIELNSFMIAKDANKLKTLTGEPSKVIVKIDPKNAQKEITDLYTKTSKVLEKIEDFVKQFAKEVDDQSKKLKDIKDKDELKSAKGALTLCKTLYKSSTTASALYLKQCNVLQAIMVSFAMHQGGDENKEENK